MSQKPRILVIDDCQLDREMSRLMLEKNGYEVSLLSGAENCLENIAQYRPSLVLLDIMMPHINGNQALQMIRGQYSEIVLPVIMVTAKSDAADVVESLKIGANDYITKPFHFDVAMRRIQTHLTISLQSNAIVHAKELTAVNATIATFNHEINNPLTIALGNVDSLKGKYENEPAFHKLEIALLRIADVVKQSTLLLQSTSIKYEPYAQNTSMISLKGGQETPK